MLLTAIVVNAKPINWNQDGFSVRGEDGDGQKQRLTVNKPGALAAFINATKDLPGPDPENSPLKDLGKDPNRVNLVITGELNADDFAALNSAVSGCGNLTTFKTLDLSGATFSIGDVSGMNLGGLEYLRLANSMTSAADVKEMGKLKQNGNANLKMVGAYDNTKEKKDGGNYAAVALYSYEANNVTPFITQMNIPTSGNPPTDVCEIRMAGEYGEKDLVSNGATGTPNFGHGTSAEWDFTGAHFADCTIPATDAAYYSYNDPFLEGGLVANTTSSNSFYYFSQYRTQVVDIKLPDTNMTNLPYRCLNDLGSANKTGYVALYGQSAFDANKAEENCVPLETLVIPDCYTDLEEECGKWARIRHLVIGSSMKRIHGGAFLKCDYLEDLDFAAGLSDCYVGDRSFNECKSMKHIALSEGIVSIGNGAFWNSQHLESIRLPQSLLFIGNNAFNNCLALNSITIPENVVQIGKGAFILCPFTDIYLATDDPAKIPLIWSAGISEAGNGFGNYDGNATFYHMHLDGWDGIPDTPQKAMLEEMTWDEATVYYYTHVNGIPVFHYNKKVADAVRAQISATYGATTTDGYGLPLRSDMYKRSNVEGADLGTVGQGKYTRDGWAQFMLMKEFSTDPGSEVYQKEYEDVWYTMCFPFDLTDEQLAAAFNETFNIVDFSGVEVKDADEEKGTPKKLVLHFNNVAKTIYRDNEGNEYAVIGREKDPTSGFSYNIYSGPGGEYHHSQVSSFLSSNKTKTFAPGNSIAESNANKDQAIIIDGYLATAGHPYMIHPAIGTSIGNPQTCTFSGIDWKPMTQWPDIFDAQKRTVDLGQSMGTIDEDNLANSQPDENNFLQAAYSKYSGQTYTFIGNAKEYRDDAQTAIGNEPQVPEEPVKPEKPTEAEVEALKPSETLSEPTVVQNPETNSKYSDDVKALFKTVRVSFTGWHAPTADQNHLYEFTYADDLVNCSNQDEFLEYREWHNNVQVKAYFYKTQAALHDSKQVQNLDALKAVLGEEPIASLDGFNNLKQLAVDYIADQSAYADYKVEYDKYIANRAAWAVYNAKKDELDNWDQATVDQDYQTALAAYNTTVATHDAWVANAKKWKTYIPKNAYFLGRRGTALPKYYREVADDPEEGQPSERSGGVWTQFTAIVIPNDAAVNGIEKELDGKTAQSKGFDMAFDEGFLGEFIEQDDVVTLIEKAQEAGAKVEYMDIVVSINGEVVRRGTTSIEGLPKGIYIVNGKKYFVK